MRVVPAVCAAFGVVLLVAAAAILHVAAGLAVAGGFLLAAGLLVDLPTRVGPHDDTVPPQRVSGGRL